ncbi:MAG: hypothetical protein CL915_07810 [Deltaproteobacteria bacterium]|nr:hypothetical protein [Deltaproteobacteria bacterium]
MNQQLKSVLEEVIFGPLFFSILIFIPYIILRRHNKISDPRWWGLTMPLLLLVFSSDLFYQVFSAPLKLITPVSEKKKAEAIIVASAGVHPSGAPTHSSAIRAHTAGLLYLENWAPEIIVAGGVMEPYDPPLEIKGIRLILRGMGIPDEAILVETKSKNTHENGFAVSEILAEKNKSRVLVVSHDYHLFRLVSVLRKYNLKVIPFKANRSYPHEPSDWWHQFEWENFNRLKTVAHEYVGIIIYKITNKI